MSSKLDLTQYFDSFDANSVYGTDEKLLHVQQAKFPFGTDEEEQENWHCMFTTKRFVLCKLNNDEMITERKSFNYRNIKSFKIKKNKRFKKNSLASSIKIYLFDHESTSKNKSKSDEDRPKIIVSFNNNDERDGFYNQMQECIDNRSSSSANKSAQNLHALQSTDKTANSSKTMYNLHAMTDLFNKLETVIGRQLIYNDYVRIKDSMDKFRFLEPAKNQAQQMIDINHNKYILKLTRDDIKHIKAYYRTKQDNFMVRNNRKQWFINAYFAAQLFKSY
eukprot:160956_1